MRSVEAVVIGAGVIGASVAYHLAARGCGPVLVLERDLAPGQGSTRRATGGFRAQFGSEINVRLSLLSREKLVRFEEELGVDSGYRRCGYLFLASDEAQLDALRGARSVQRAAGLEDAREVGPEEVGDINPAVRTEGLIGGVLGPTDGFLKPMEVLRGYVEGAQRLGVRFEYGVECTGFELDGLGRIAAVRTPDSDVAAGSVVNAAGPWAASLGRHAGLEVPVEPLRRRVAVTGPFDELPEDMPMTVFLEDGFHLRVRDGRVLLLLPDEPDAADPFDQSVEDAWVEAVLGTARERVPCLEEASIDRAKCWAGLYEMSPDDHALLGRVEEIDNLYLANGSSGHGVMHAPALGQLLAEIMLDGAASTLDTHALRPSRFAEGESNLAFTLL
ncbi:MAG TPA: FAD-binding oxidoreductase [Rubrobacteraceae bacterium]|nr:FAD-binding oxidoreductase [Rubrobacteraceae bacterium]